MGVRFDVRTHQRDDLDLDAPNDLDKMRLVGQ